MFPISRLRYILQYAETQEGQKLHLGLLTIKVSDFGQKNILSNNITKATFFQSEITFMIFSKHPHEL